MGVDTIIIATVLLEVLTVSFPWISTSRDVPQLQRRSYMVSSSCKRRFKGPKSLECGIGGRRGAKLHFLVYKEYIDFMTPKSIIMHSRLRWTGCSIVLQHRRLDE